MAEIPSTPARLGVPPQPALVKIVARDAGELELVIVLSSPAAVDLGLQLVALGQEIARRRP